MADHRIGTREEWLAARLELLEAEKELTRRSDEVARQRQELPWVRIDKEYRFETDDGPRNPGRPVPRALAAARLPLHVRARVHGGLPVLLGDRGRLQRLRRPPRQPRRHALRGVAGAAGEAAGVQAADGLELPVGVVVRQRLQLRLPRVASPRSSSGGSVEYNFRADGPAAVAGGRPRRAVLAEIAARVGTDWATYRRRARA